jgi:hypothetical protein
MPVVGPIELVILMAVVALIAWAVLRLMRARRA